MFCTAQPVVFAVGALAGQRKALVFQGPEYTPQSGRGRGVCLGEVSDSLLFRYEIDSSHNDLSYIGKRLSLRLFPDNEMALEINYRKYEIGNTLSLWFNNGHPEWCCYFLINEDFSLSPADCPSLCLGVAKDKYNLCLVSVKSTDDKLFLEDPLATLTDYSANKMVSEERREWRIKHLKNWGLELCNSSMLSALKRDGFVHLPQLIDKELVRNALREINRQIGSSIEGMDKFKAKSFAVVPALTDLFNKSVLPHLLELLLSTKDLHLAGGQIAIRFPGDACVDGTCLAPADHMENVRKGWHIDGLASDFWKGVTDHYGEIHNFDALVGVLLNDVDEAMSGELCCYPGSHDSLAKHFCDVGIDTVSQIGAKALPYDQTDVLFERPYHSCVGKAGDVFLANYMTAHFVAPNTSPFIRYAVYFRIYGPRFQATVTGYAPCKDSIALPWLHWPAMNDV